MATAKGTVLVTGANGGLGSAIAGEIASKSELSGYYGIYTVRHDTVAPGLTQRLASGNSSHRHELLSLDLTKLDNIRQVAQDINNRVSAGQIPSIRVLILNAGFQDFGKQSWTEDGLDVTFAANYLGHWLLTLLLLRSMDKDAGKIIVIGSQSHDPEDKRNTVTGAFTEEKHKTFVRDEASFEAIAKGTWSSAAEDSSFRGGFRRYGAAKLFSIMMMHELQQRMNQEATLKNIRIIGVDPGGMISGMQRLAPWGIRVLMFQVMYRIVVWISPNGSVRLPQRAASDVLEVVFGSGSGESPAGSYFSRTQPMEPSVESKDPQKLKLVWRETSRYAGLKDGDTILGDWQ